MEITQILEWSAPKEVTCANSFVPSGNQPTGDQPGYAIADAALVQSQVATQSLNPLDSL
jgi:hypothetical protein